MTPDGTPPAPRFTRAAHSGTGPGEITPDGCAVEMYAQLPEGVEPALIAASVPRTDGATLLELGAGTGRLTRPLLALGFRVTAVDESAAMLARIAPAGAAPAGTVSHGAATVRSAIEDLDLGQRFDVVTLTSCLVNTADPAQCVRLLRTCAAHVAEGGQVIIQREPQAPLVRPRTGDSWTRGGMSARVVSDEPVQEPDDGTGVRRICVAYTAGGGGQWTQTFYSRPLTTPALRDALAAAGLALDTFLSEDGSWVRAVPPPREGAPRP